MRKTTLALRSKMLEQVRWCAEDRTNYESTRYNWNLYKYISTFGYSEQGWLRILSCYLTRWRNNSRK